MSQRLMESGFCPLGDKPEVSVPVSEFVQMSEVDMTPVYKLTELGGNQSLACY